MEELVRRRAATPCILVMGIMEGWTIGLTILASTIISKGINPFIFVAYSSLLSSLFLLPSFSFHFTISIVRTEFSLLIRIITLALIGIPIAQNLAYVGLSYSSPIVACVMANLIPAISFLLNILLRRSRIDLRKVSSRIKIVGSLISIVGALSTTFYKGPVISPQLMTISSPRLFVFMSPNQRWILGCALFAAASLSFAVWNLVQVETVKLYPDADAMKIASSYTIIGTLVTVIVAVVMERDLTAWGLNMDINNLLVIVLTAVFGSVVRNRGQMWCTKLKGPFFVPLFKPLTVPYAIFCGCYFFPHTFHYGSIVGAVIVGMGYYTVMWGMMKEQGDGEIPRTVFSHKGSSEDDLKVPLLQKEEV
ncbi:WAT1-related protein At1g70260-like [Impatiens glandulifera]|uniref:WAT1-related protein At1g70260-like n=1 Tax=Impatiens glandulifera TaxID=253017 RepID=UPI001FB07553|nr:WAT1-related protein At1g70260-like [Impatiens glandulifera]